MCERLLVLRRVELPQVGDRPVENGQGLARERRELLQVRGAAERRRLVREARADDVGALCVLLLRQSLGTAAACGKEQAGADQERASPPGTVPRWRSGYAWRSTAISAADASSSCRGCCSRFRSPSSCSGAAWQRPSLSSS